MTISDLDKMNHHTVNVKGKDGLNRQYKGILLADILALAGVSAEKMTSKKIIKSYLLIQAADGFEVVFSLAEIDPAFTDKEIILGDEVENKPLTNEKGPYQIIVPNEKKPTRNIYQVTTMTVCSTF